MIRLKEVVLIHDLKRQGEQDKATPKKRRAGKQRTRYEPTGRRNNGWNTLADRKRIADRKASQGCDI